MLTFQKQGFEDYPEGSWFRNSTATYDNNKFNEEVVRDNFKAIKSWGANGIRVIERVQWWRDNTPGGTGKAHRDVVKRLIEIAHDEGLYVILALFSLNESKGFHGIPWQSSYIPSLNDFVSLWRNITTELSVYPNVLFEVWNEPDGGFGNKDEWLNGCQQVITAIREVTDNIIIVGWGYGVWVLYDENGTIVGGWKSFLGKWITDPRIQGENILYTTHIYNQGRGRIEYANGTRRNLYEYEDVKKAFTDEEIMWTINDANKPLYIGEYGPYPTKTDIDLTSSRNGLKIFNEWNVSYNCMWWRHTSSFGLWSQASNFPPTNWGQIVLESLAEAPY